MEEEEEDFDDADEEEDDGDLEYEKTGCCFGAAVTA